MEQSWDPGWDWWDPTLDPMWEVPKSWSGSQAGLAETRLTFLPGLLNASKLLGEAIPRPPLPTTATEENSTDEINHDTEETNTEASQSEPLKSE